MTMRKRDSRCCLYLIRTDGIKGAAIAWTLRVSVEAVVLFVVARSMLDEPLVEVSVTEAT